MARLRTLLAVLGIAVLAGCSSTPPPPAPKPALQVSTEIKSLMWVGNSFFYCNNSMHGHTGQLLAASGANGMRASSITISGSGINYWHDVKAYAGLPPDVARHLQAVAWETAQAFHAQQGRGSL